MTQLAHVSIAGLKNHRRTELAITPLLALTGQNGAGKSAIGQAITIATLGYDPMIGKKLEATRQLMGPGHKDVTIALTFNDGFGIERTIGKSMEIEVQPARGERTLDEMQERINQQLGNFILSFDLNAFLSLSSEKRRAFLLSILPRDLVQLDESDFRRELGYDDAGEIIQRAITTLWMDHVIVNHSLADGLAAAIDHTNKRTNESEQARRDQVTISTAADAEATVTTNAAPDPDRLPALQAEHAGVQQEIGELHERRAAAERHATDVRHREHDRNVLDSRLAAAQRDVDLVEDALKAPFASDEQLAALEEAARYAETKARSQRDAVIYAGERRASLKSQLDDAGTRRKLLEGKSTCPTCGGIESVDQARTTYEADMRALSGALETAEEQCHKAAELQRQYDEASDSARNELAGAREGRNVRLRAMADLRTAKNRVEHVSAEINNFTIPAGPEFTETDMARLSSLSARASELRAEIDLEQQRLKDTGKAEAARERADVERRKLEQVTDRTDALKGLLNSLQRLRAHVVEQLVAPVESTANEILQRVDPAKTFKFIFEREKKDEFDFGFEEDGVFRSYDAASTGEDAFLAVVLVASLISAVAPRWRLLLVDNIESVDAERRRWLMIALTELIGSRLDNVIVAGCCDFAEVEGWQIVEVEKLTSSSRSAVAA